MKTMKIALIAALVCFVAMSYAKEEPKTYKLVKISLEQAKKDPGLVAAMKFQLDTEFLKIEHPGWYIGVVKYRNATYVIYGTRNAWLRFFNLSMKKRPGKCIQS